MLKDTFSILGVFAISLARQKGVLHYIGAYQCGVEMMC